MTSAEWLNKTQEEIQGAFAAATEKPRKGPKPGYRAPIKYRGPNGETWTGRGLLPRWIKDSGKDKSEFRVFTTSVIKACSECYKPDSKQYENIHALVTVDDGLTWVCPNCKAEWKDLKFTG